MASTLFSAHFVLKLLFVFSLFHTSFGTRKLTALFQPLATQLKYHNGPLLSGDITVNLIWYGIFDPSQCSIISDFILSLSSSSPSQPQGQPSVATWFANTNEYYPFVQGRNPTSVSVSLGNQTHDEGYSLGKSLTQNNITQLASTAYQTDAIVIVLTSADVLVEKFCMICGTHGSSDNKLVYIWVGNSETQCPGHCAWPFHQPIYGPQSPPLIAPNADVGMDGVVINVASLLVGAITNPYGNGIYQGLAVAPLEACAACTGIYGKGAYAGFPGKLLVDPTTGASYNAVGVNRREYCLPACFNPLTSSCSTLV